jgi:predicted phage terminase large subunit-like protein
MLDSIEKSLFEQSLLALPEAELRQILTEMDAEASRKLSPISLVRFVELTTSHKLDRWQFDLCKRLETLAETQGRRVLVHAPPQAGKPCYNEAMILMADGTYKPLKSVQVGELVITHTGRRRKVLAVHEQGELECIKVMTHGGRETIAAFDHPFLTPEGWIEAGNLRIGQALACVAEADCGGDSGHSDDEFELLGYFVGDGAVGPAGPSVHAQITSNDPEQAKRFMEVAARLGFQCRIYQKAKTTALTYAFRGGVRQWLRDTGIAGATSGFKEIPEWVFRGNNRQIALFVGAYFSCDGHISPRGMGRDGMPRTDAAIEFYSVSEPLLTGVQRLLLRLGIQSRLAPKNGRYNGRRHESHRLSFFSSDYAAQFAAKVPIPGVKGETLRSLRPLRKTFQGSLLADPITAIEPVGKLLCRCLIVEEDHTFTVDDLVVHNSIIVSQRFPAWLLARKPRHRVKLACYNVTHATRFGRIVRDLMQADEFVSLFPDPGLRLPAMCSAEEWSTAARLRTRDSQPSFKALGLATGFVGQGADTLIIDDPYASPEEAYSQVINAKVHGFWSDTARPRLNEQTNVVVMFHRYTENDLAGWLMEQEPNEWELIRYAAEADGDYTHPATGKKYLDPLGRPLGEFLSPRYSKAWYERQRENGYVWLSQFQGRPTPKEGAFFKVTEFEIIESQVTQTLARLGALKTTRAWDLGASVKGDYSVGVKIGKGPNGEFYVLDVVRGQWAPDERNKVLLQTAHADGRPTRIRLPQDPGQAGVDQALALTRLLAGYVVRTERVSGTKETRADGFAAQVNGRNVKLVRGDWNRQFIEELRSFPLGKNDDQVDAASDAFQELAAPIEWKTA